MNGIDELRATLDEHAHDLVDHDRPARVVAVGHRVAQLRRRRRAAAGLGAAVVLALAAGLALLPGLGGHGDTPPADTVVGVTAPARLHSLGFTYRYAEGVDGHDGKAVLRLQAEPQPRLVSWATSGGDQRVTLDSPVLGSPTAFAGPDFDDFTLIPAGTTYTVKVRAERGQPGLALYTLTDDRPPGITEGGATFRKTIAGGHLLGAAVGRPGQADLTVPATATGVGIEWKAFCSAGPAHAYLHIERRGDDGDIASGQGCSATVPVDPASSGSTGQASRAGEDVTTRFWVTRGPGGPVIDDPDIVLGLGVYAVDTDPTGPRGFTPEVVEEGGHTWRRADLVRSTDGSRRITTTAPDGQGQVLAILYGDVAHGVSVQADFATSAGIGMAGGGATRQVVPAGSPVTVTARGGTLTPGDDFGVAFYLEAD